MVTEVVAEHGTDIGLTGYAAIGASVLVSAFGWYAVSKWMQPSDAGVKFLLAFLRTFFALIPAVVGFWIASKRQRASQARMAADLDRLRNLMSDYQKLVAVDHELKTMDSLSKVARNAVVATATSAKNLYGAIVEIPGDGPSKTILLERFKNHSNSVMTTLTAVQEQMNEIGTAVADILTSHEEIDIVKRKTRNSESGLTLARQMVEARGVGDGLKLISNTLEQAQSLQDQLSIAYRGLQAPAIEGGK